MISHLLLCIYTVDVLLLITLWRHDFFQVVEKLQVYQACSSSRLKMITLLEELRIRLLRVHYLTAKISHCSGNSWIKFMAEKLGSREQIPPLFFCSFHASIGKGDHHCIKYLRQSTHWFQYKVINGHFPFLRKCSLTVVQNLKAVFIIPAVHNMLQNTIQTTILTSTTTQNVGEQT